MAMSAETKGLEAERRRREEMSRVFKLRELLTIHERSSICNGLRIAVDAYHEDIKVFQTTILSDQAKARLLEQFERQVADTKAIIEMLEL